MRTIARTIAILLLCQTAWGVDYAIVAVRIPWDGVTVQTWPSATNPLAVHTSVSGPALASKPQAGGDLVLIAPDGTETVLVDSGEEGNLFEPQLDDAAENVYYAKRLAGKFDIYRLNLSTREETKVVSGGNNIGPAIMGHQLTWSSDRDGFWNNGNFVGNRRPNCFLTFSADLDGKNVERIGAWHLGGALHNEPLPSGQWVFSTDAGMGGKSPLNWGLWSYGRDGRGFEPLLSTYAPGGNTAGVTAVMPDGSLAYVRYYSPRNATGTIERINPWPTGSPAPPSRFVSVAKTGLANVALDEFRQEFMTTGGLSLTPFTHGGDRGSKFIDGVRQGFVAHPSAAPDGLLLTVTGSNAPVLTASGKDYNARSMIGLLPNYQPATNLSQLTIIKSDPRYSYMMPRAVVPRHTPEMRPWSPNDGTQHPAILPKGTPFALIGSASTLDVEWLNWGFDPQGGQIAPVVTNDDPHYIRIYSQRPAPVGVKFSALLNERLEILADIPIRHKRSDGTVPLDADGNPDTSWLAKVPADTSVTFGVLNSAKELIALARSWHGFRPGEVRHDCGGCHRHVKSATNWESTLAFRFLNGTSDAPFTIADATVPRIIQRERDVQPTLDALGLTAKVYRGAHYQIAGDYNVLPARALRSPLYTELTGASDGQKRLIGDWIDSGASEGANILTDDLHPILTIQEPNREQVTPITAIRFGDYDLHSGVASRSVRASFVVQGRPPGTELADLLTTVNHVSELAIPEQAEGEVTVTVTDAAGNSETMTRTFPGKAPGNAERERLLAELESVRAQIAAGEANLVALRNREAAILRELGL